LAATSEAEAVRFNVINPDTNNRIDLVTVDAETREEVEHGDLVKGFQVANNEYVLFTKEELDAAKIESTKILDIEKLVPRSSMDRLYWDRPYHLVPSGKPRQGRIADGHGRCGQRSRRADRACYAS
jgi:DNA end-binding protein Ku